MISLAKAPMDQRFEDALETGDVTFGKRPTSRTRLTINVPTEHTRLSLGGGQQADDASNAIEPGITAETAEHIHLETKSEGPFGNLRGLLSIGRPSARDPRGQNTAEGGSEASWPHAFAQTVRADLAQSQHSLSDSQDVTVGQPASGYALFTTGSANTYAARNARFVSVGGNWLGRAMGKDKFVGLHADQGHAQVLAKDQIVVGGDKIIISTVNQELPSPAEGYDYSLGAFATSTKWTGYTAAGLGALVSGVGLVGTLIQYKWWTPIEEFPAWAPKLTLGTKVVGGVGGISETLIRIGLDMGAGWDKSVTIYGDRGASLTSGMSASVYGQTKASVGALGWASMASVFTSSMGVLLNGMSSGLETSISSLKDVAIGAQWGKTTMTGGLKGVEVSTAKGKMVLASLRNMTMHASQGKILIGSGNGVTLGAGMGPGFGLTTNASGMHLGFMPAVFPLATAAVGEGAGPSISLEPVGISLAMGTTRVTWNPMAARSSAANVEIEALGSATVDAPLLLLG